MWKATFAAASSETMATTFRLFHLRPASISRAAAAARRTRNAASTASAIRQPITSENEVAALPATQDPNSTASGLPWIGSRPVQLGIAVKRNPATTALTYPNSISWTCQSRGANAVGNERSPANAASHNGTAAPA